MQWQCKNFTELNIEELYSIMALRNQVFIVEQNCIYQDLDSRDQQSMHLFAQSSGKLAAYARVLPLNNRPAPFAIGRVIVAPEFRGQGLAKEIVARAITFLRDQKQANRIFIQAQTYLLPFYERFGFTAISKEYLEDNIPHCDMLWQQK